MQEKIAGESRNPQDVIFGPQFDPRNRTEAHLSNITGIQHLNRRDPLIPAKGQPIRLIVTTSGEIPFDSVTAWYSYNGEPERQVAFARGDVEWDQISWSYVRYWEATLPPAGEDGRLTYRIGGRAAGSRDEMVFADNQAVISSEATVFSVFLSGKNAPDWAAKAVVYHVFVDRFHPGEGRTWQPEESLMGFHGGTLQGIIEKIDYLQSLGFNTLWLSPVFESPTHHGYDATDLLKVEPRFGTNEDLERLISELHQRGMRIILDFVPNHWSNQHPTFLDAQENEQSTYRDWYFWKDWPQKYEMYFEVKTMPKLNLHENSGARSHLMEAACYWLRKGVDGYRLDHAEGPPVDFWAEFREACVAENSDVWLFGEIVRPPDVLKTYSGGMHGCLDFALAQALRETFAMKNWSLGRFESFLSNHRDFFPDGYSLPAFLDNHDMNRFKFIAAEDERRLKIGALILYMLKGAPIIYYGTERGLSQDRSTRSGVGLDEARKHIEWSEGISETLPAYFRNLARIRAALGLTAADERKIECLSIEHETYAFSWTANGRRRALIAVNLSDSSRVIEVEAEADDVWEDRLEALPVSVSGNMIRILLSPMSGAVLMPA